MSSESLDKSLNLNNDEVYVRSDQQGRSLANDFYLRGITATASASITRAQETQIMAGDSANFLDLVQISAANTSTSAITVQIRSGTAGTVLDQLSIPAAGANGANGTFARNTYWPALPQSEAGQAWTAQLTNTGEISDSPVTIFVMAIKNPNLVRSAGF